MAVTRYAGDRFVIGGSDNEPTGVLDGAYLINTGTLSQKVLRNGTWATLAGGGGGSTNPAAPLNSVQFNDSSTFGGSANLTFTDGNRLNVNKLGISGNIYDSNNSLGEGGMVLTNEGQTGVNWKSIESVLSGVGGSGVQNYVARWADEDTLTSGTIYDDGDVGIGTANPGAKFHVFDTTASDLVILESSHPSLTNAPDVIFYRNSESPADSDELGVLKFRGRNDNSQDVNYALFEAEAVTIADGAEGGALNFYTYENGSSAKRVTITGSNLGIGTASPYRKLHVNGDAIISGKFYDVTNSTGDKGYVLTSDDNGPVWAASGDFDTLSGNLVATGAIVDDISGNLITSGQTLTNNLIATGAIVDDVSGNLITTGQTLTTNINTVSTNLIATGAVVDNISGNLIETGQYLTDEIAIVSGLATGGSAEDFAALSGALIATGAIVDDVSGNLITTGQTLTTNINTVSTNLVATGAIVDDISGNLITTGQTLTTNINTVSTNLIATGAIVDDISGNLIQTGQYLTDEIAIVSGLVSTGAIDGSGVANYVAKWSDQDTLTSGTIYDDGDVGIGTANPGAKLHVLDNVAGDVVILETTHPSASNGPDIVFYRNSDSPDDADELGRLAFRGKNDADQDINYANIIAEAVDVSDGNEDGALKFNTFLTGVNTETMVLRSANVGIGTNNPFQLLHVYQAGTVSNGYYEGGVKVGGSTAALGAFLGYNASASGRVSLTNLNNTGGNNALISFGFGAATDGTPDTLALAMNQNGNVGIGTNVPWAGFHVLRTTIGGWNGLNYNVVIASSNTYANGHAGGINFAGAYNSSETQTSLAGIWASRPNAGDGQYGGMVHIGGREHGTSNIPKVINVSHASVGIGTTDAGAKLHVQSSDSVVAYVIRPSASPTVHIGSATSAGAQLGYVHAHDYAFYGHDSAYNAIVVKSDWVG